VRRALLLAALLGLALGLAAFASTANAAARRSASKPRPATPPAATAAAVETPGPPAPLTDEEVLAFVRLWPVYREALGALGRAPAPEESPGGDPLAAADAAFAAASAVRDAFEKAGISTDTFLDLYRRISTAWFALLEREERAATDAAFNAQLAALAKVAHDDEGASETLRALTDAAAARPAPSGAEVPSASIENVARHRADLRLIFGNRVP
jgi:hypothetical protein